MKTIFTNKQFYVKLIWVLSFLSLTLISTNPSILSIHVSSYEYAVFFGLTIVCVFLMMFGKGLSFNIVPLFIILRTLLFFVSILMNGLSIYYFYNELIANVTYIIVYLYCFSYGEEGTKIDTMFTCLSSLITVQLVGSLLNGGADDKNLILSGIGYSNYAATFLLMAFVYLLFAKKTKLGLFGLLVSFIGLLITKSFGAYVALIFAIVIAIIYYRKICVKYLKLKYIIPAVVVLAVGCFIGRNILFELFDVAIRKIGFLLEGNFNALGSSRLELYSFSINNAFRHPFLGSIVNYDSLFPADYRYQYFRTHNLILESIMQYGFVGSILNLCLCIYMIVQVKKKKIGRKRKAMIMCIAICVIHGFVEPNFFTVQFELFMFTIYGLLMSDKLEDEEDERNSISGGLGNEIVSPNPGNE